MKKIRNLLILIATLIFILLVVLTATATVPTLYLVGLFWIIGVILLLWLGNRFISIWLNRHYPWADYDTRRFYIQIFLSTIYSLLCVNLSYYIIKNQVLGFPPDQQQLIVLNVYGLILIIPILSIQFGIYFMMRWKKNFSYSKELQSQNIKAQFESLKSHVSPHFLFNNLNVLSSLIDKNPDLAQKFLESFSDVYRYVLSTNNQELIELATEMEFIDSYIFMLKIRFVDQLQIQMDIKTEFHSHLIPPLALQTLVENAMKHNKATEAAPLIVQIFTDKEGKLTVTNNLQLRKKGIYSAESGLKNLAKRYELLANLPIEILEDSQYFTVKLPLITPS
ncbi:histidine kinase [Dyadobacter jejuensis]|uniref:Histidine kinase n=1 Tax=Dyadobacter jejuensis TaxID=1082580 RepID=A0A316AKX9_9BACT|nr:histidine kinase [Dyadobacter jejuensis]PWJ57909.1 histidine kinase [Dyadobacter jejuensis]